MPSPIATSTILPQAFRLMEMSPPSSFADTSEKSTSAAEQYFRARDMVLESYDWSDARRVWTLAAATLKVEDGIDPDLPYAVKLPAECLRLRHVYEGNCFLWRLDGRILRAERAPPLTIRGTRQIERESDLSQTLQLAIAYQLAVLLSPTFAKTRAKREELHDGLANVIAQAKKNDRHTAASARMDGAPESVDWPTEAMR